MNKKEFLLLIDKYLAGECSSEEEELLLNFYNSFQKTSDVKKLSIDEALEIKMLSRIKQGIRKKEETTAVSAFVWRKLAIAASVIFIISSGLYFFRNSNSKETAANVIKTSDVDPGASKAVLTLADGSHISLYEAQNGILANQGNVAIAKTTNGKIVYQEKLNGPESGTSLINTIAIPKSGKYSVVLSDGSKVWLNSASSLSYPIKFSGKERIVKLKGEAYFEIAHDKTRPFLVVSNNQTVEVLGTHFNINSYEDEAYIKTTLLEGSVRVIRNASGNETGNIRLLKPGQQSLINSSQSGIKVETADIEKAIAWKNGYFRFRNTGIKDIMKEIERWYDVKIEYQNGKVPSDELNGFISRDVKLSNVLNMLEQSAEIHFDIDGKTIKISSE